MPDAAAFGDVGANTLGNTAKLSTTETAKYGRLGIGNITDVKGVPAVSEANGR